MLGHQEICRRILTAAQCADGRIRTIRGAVRWLIRTGRNLSEYTRAAPPWHRPDHSFRRGPLWLSAWMEYAARVEDLVRRGYAADEARRIAASASGNNRNVFVEAATPPDVDATATRCYGWDVTTATESGLPVEHLRRWTQWRNATAEAKPSRVSKRMRRQFDASATLKKKWREERAVDGRNVIEGIEVSGVAETLTEMSGLAQGTPLSIVADKLTDMGQDKAATRARGLIHA